MQQSNQARYFNISVINLWNSLPADSTDSKVLLVSGTDYLIEFPHGIFYDIVMFVRS